MPRQPVDCQFLPSGTAWACVRCGIVRPRPIRRNCRTELAEPDPVPHEQGVAPQLWDAIVAALAGPGPHRPAEEILAILATRCGPCDSFTGCSCREFGSCAEGRLELARALTRPRGFCLRRKWPAAASPARRG